MEVEFGSREASERFAPPPWIGRELTGDKRYANQSLALAGRPPAAVSNVRPERLTALILVG